MKREIVISCGLRKRGKTEKEKGNFPPEKGKIHTTEKR